METYRKRVFHSILGGPPGIIGGYQMRVPFMALVLKKHLSTGESLSDTAAWEIKSLKPLQVNNRYLRRNMNLVVIKILLSSLLLDFYFTIYAPSIHRQHVFLPYICCTGCKIKGLCPMEKKGPSPSQGIKVVNREYQVFTPVKERACPQIQNK